MSGADMARPTSAKQPAPQGLMGTKAQSRGMHRQSQESSRQSQEDVWQTQETNIKPRQETILDNQRLGEAQRRGQTRSFVSAEDMQRELMQYKQEMNIFSLENIQLKTKIQKFRNDIEKKDKVIGSILEKLSSNQEGNVKLMADPETGKILSLKQQVKDLREKLRIKKDTHAEMEGYMKNTEVGDAEARVDAAMRECKEIRAAIEKEQLGDNEPYDPASGVRRLERRLEEQNEAIVNMRKSNDQLSIKVKRKEKSTQEANEQVGRVEAQKQKYVAEHKRLAGNKTKLAKANKELAELKEQIEYLDTNGNRTDTYKERLDELTKELKELGEETANKEGTIKRLREETNGRKAAENKKRLKAEISHVQTQLAASNSATNSIDNEELRRINAEKKPKPKVQPVNRDSLSSNALKYGLIYFKIQSFEIPDKVFKGYDSEDTISIYELARMLMRISRGQDCEKIARFLIEAPSQNQDGEYEYDNQAERSVKEVSNKLINFVGNYTIPQGDTEQDLKLSITKVIAPSH
eukprot:TRINITY_DN10130_c0_g4_i2.p1 TRINITY_DN10130_c0_g4~~TRINITY_DN10130_c0_g4_i2.p1  ORF type:complete len:522 (-),score=174.68 TRINITY_DN10130_c0_g4_i2:1529-3094(-)